MVKGKLRRPECQHEDLTHHSNRYTLCRLRSARGFLPDTHKIQPQPWLKNASLPATTIICHTTSKRTTTAVATCLGLNQQKDHGRAGIWLGPKVLGVPCIRCCFNDAQPLSHTTSGAVCLTLKGKNRSLRISHEPHTGKQHTRRSKRVWCSECQLIKPLSAHTYTHVGTQAAEMCVATGAKYALACVLLQQRVCLMLKRTLYSVAKVR